ncbi:MAG TPA: 3-dehydroquinate synthase [Rubricoccaceae bacterium]
MITVTHAAGRYAVHTEALACTPARLREAGLAPGLALVVTDATVAGLYLDALARALRADGWTPHPVVVAPGEGSKSLASYADVCDAALSAGPSRATPVLALGGGVVGDLGGFAAATLLRGLPLIHLPTTVLAQVDSSIGGKTGVNTSRGKNLVGAFWAPRFVLADPAVLATLPAREVRSGLAEAVKHGLLAGGPLLDLLIENRDRLAAPDGLPPDVLGRIVHEAAAVKAAVVSADERESGARAHLNLGHTFGHALEAAAGYGTLTHGEAVAVGMRAALHLSASLATGGAVAALAAPWAEMDALVARLDPPAVPETVTTDALVSAMTLDKKRDAAGLRFVVLDDVGAPRLASRVSEALVRAAWAYARSGPALS